MPKTAIGSEGDPAPKLPSGPSPEATSRIEAEAAKLDIVRTPPPWASLKVVVIDDAMHPARLDRLDEREAADIGLLLTSDAEVIAELIRYGMKPNASPDERLRILSEAQALEISAARIAGISEDALRMIEEHRALRSLVGRLEEQVAEVQLCDPFESIPELVDYQLVLLDYYLQGPAMGGDLAVAVAMAITGQRGWKEDQQVVLMSSRETVRDLRGEFRSRAGVTGSAFAFVGKSDLDEAWKVKAHLGMLERARPYAPAFSKYRANLDEALGRARDKLLALVDDLDIGDYAFIQGHALMKDGHPLGDYVFWLLSSHLVALGFEGNDMRERQRALDTLEFVGEPFASTEPSTVVASLLHSALVSRNMGPLGPHPRATRDGKYASFPLVQLGDVFLDNDVKKAVVVMSADCDLAFSPIVDREPELETPVMLVPGTPSRLREAGENADPKTDGIVHREEVYRIVWEFAKYRSVRLGDLRAWLQDKGFNTSNRDRLRPLFALKLQQEFGAHLLRVGPPVTPPMTYAANGRIILCTPDLQEGPPSTTRLMLTRLRASTLLRVTVPLTTTLKAACENLLLDLEGQLANEASAKKKSDLTKKVVSLRRQVENDEFWIDLLKGVEVNVGGGMKGAGPLGFVLGSEWQAGSKPRVVLEIIEVPGEDGRSGASRTTESLIDDERSAAVSAP